MSYRLKCKNCGRYPYLNHGNTHVSLGCRCHYFSEKTSGRATGNKFKEILNNLSDKWNGAVNET